MNVASISVTKQFGFGLNVLGQSSREKSVRIGQGNTDGTVPSPNLMDAALL